ncbi:uncharacterized protein LOC121377317 isoform X2 [Gigantopelta aegis]|uniref:uncharacterized protein LOC121377317 isoform X2 n=1 Tax=Gigantopelta aegis TaxID=1735272 RepID=UPI001B88C8C4|nr:uncharacterized protein LOC121377317 isoform X2 [Gigantopelta aegis]
MREVVLIGFLLLVLFNTAVFTGNLSKYKYHAPKSTMWYNNAVNRKNWALHGTANQSSSLDPVDDPERVVDGNRTNTWNSRSCSTTESSRNPWWYVKLQQKIRIEEVLIVSRCCVIRSRLGDFWIHILNESPRVFRRFSYAGYCRHIKGNITAGVSRLVPCVHPVLGQIVRISMDGNNRAIDLCEVEVYGTPYVPEINYEKYTTSFYNWARGMTATQSSESKNQWRKSASNAVDGDYKCKDRLGSFTHTNEQDSEPWWMVDLQQILVITHVKVYNRMDCCRNDLRRFEVRILFQPDDPEPAMCWFQEQTVMKESTILPCITYVKGRYVRINYYGPLELRPLSLCEVEVTAWKVVTDPEYHKSRDNLVINKKTYQSTTDGHRDSYKAVDGNPVNNWLSNTCSRTAIDDNYPWWMVDLGGKMFVEAVLIFFPLEKVETFSENWAVYKPALQSSTYSGLADKAVDGGYMCAKYRYTLSVTDPTDKYPWWMVDLVDTIMVKEVKIFNRQDCCKDRLVSFYIEVLQSKNDTVPGICHYQRYIVDVYGVFPCNRYLRGRYVRIRKEGPASENLGLCEVEVKGYKLVASKDWAKGMPTFQSSVTGNMSSNLAVDENYKCSVPGSFAQTYEHDLNAWWMVDLKQTISVTEVIIYNPESKDTSIHNWAWHMPTSQSTESSKSGNAVDGFMDTLLHCAQTQVGDFNPWWAVNLQELIEVEVVIIKSINNSLHDIFIEILQGFPSPTHYGIDKYPPSLCYHQTHVTSTNARCVCDPPSKGRTVKISKERMLDGRDVLTLCEVEVQGRKIPRDSYNWAWARPAFQSTTYKHFDANLAVDGNKNLWFHGGSCTSTAVGDSHPWWMVDLEMIIMVDMVVIYNQLGSNELRLHNFYIEILLQRYEYKPAICHYQDEAITLISVLFVCNPSMKGRYVRIRKESVKSPDDVLTLCEVEVRGGIRVAPGIESAFWSRGMRAFQSSEGGKAAALAVDGDYSCDINYSCTHELDKTPWWMVDMGQIIQVLGVKMAYNSSCCGGQPLSNFFIEVTKTYKEVSPPICHYQNASLTKSTTFLCNPHLLGQYVRIRKAPLSNSSATNILALCEVDVQGMTLGHYSNEFNVEVLQSGHDSAPLVCPHETLAVDRSVMFWCHPPLRGRYVKVSKTYATEGNHVLKLCEVEVKGVPTVPVDITSENWAVGKPASQSSTQWNKPARNAVDGNYNCSYYGSITHTDVNDKFPWWMVDLETWINVTAVKLYNRADCCPQRLHDFTVEVIGCLNMEPGICHNQTTAVEKFLSVSCNPPLTGRYVRIRKYGPMAKDDVLSLCEVEVLGVKTGESNRICTHNWAKGKVASQSTTFQSNSARHAIDGNFFCEADVPFSETNVNDQNPWWMVDLLSTFSITAVKLYNRADCCQYRLKNLAIEILKQADDTLPVLCCNLTREYIETHRKFFCTPPLEGRYVRIRKYGPVPFGETLSFCEVKVFGSKVVPGFESDNWARGMPAIQSTTDNALEARIAVDGDYSCFVGPPWTTETLDSDPHPWWMVDLEKLILVTSVTVFSGNHNTELLKDFVIDCLKSRTDPSPSLCHHQVEAVKTNENHFL